MMAANLAPGSVLWLLRHEVRMFFSNMGGVGRNGVGKRGMGAWSIAVWAVAQLMLHGLAWFALRGLGKLGELPAIAAVLASFVLLTMMTMMMSTALGRSVEALFERGDLDLLLSSPLPTRSIFVTRLAGIVVSVSALYLFFLAPVAHAGLLLGQPRWLAVYPTIISLALVAASLAMLLTLGLVRLLGVRRTRVVAQILAALSGALIFLTSQLGSPLLRGRSQGIMNWIMPMTQPGGALHADSLLWLPGRALLGDPASMLIMLLAGAAVFMLTVRNTHRFFAHGVQQAVSKLQTAKAPAGGVRYRFDRSLTATVILKELRLIRRDPSLISQVLLQLLYMLPMFFVLLKNGNGPAGMTGTALTFLCGSLASSLAWIVISAEDAPDLLLSAPCRPWLLQRAKVIAATLPPLALVGVPLAWVGLHQPLVAALIFMICGVAVVSAACIVLWSGRAGSRSDFKARSKGNVLHNLMELISSCAWTSVSYQVFAGMGQGGFSSTRLMLLGGSVALGLLVLGAAWLLRRR